MMTTTTASTASTNRNSLIAAHADMARRIAKKMQRRCPDWVSADDLVSAGMVGLIEAADRYDASRPEPFGAFAEMRIRGAILDELRRGDIMPRRQRQTARKIQNAIRTIEVTGETATDERVAAAIGVTIERYRGGLAGLVNVGIDELDETTTSAPAATISLEDQIARRHLLARVKKALTSVGQRDVTILDMYYVQDMTFAEIGAALSVTPSRVCQLLRRTVERLRDALGADVPAMAA